MQLTSETFLQNLNYQRVRNNGLMYPSTGQMFEKISGDFQAAFLIVLVECSTAYQSPWFVSGL